MHKLYPIMTIIMACLCFYAGYLTGSKKVLIQTYDSRGADKAVELDDELELELEPSEPLIEEPVVAQTIAPSLLAQRALQTEITFTDKKGRELEGEVLEVNRDSLIVRRTYDNRVVTLPINLLSEADTAFAKYLLEIKNKKSMEEKIWDELFQDL